MASFISAISSIRSWLMLGIFAQRHLDILRHGLGGEQRAFLEQHAPAHFQLAHGGAFDIAGGGWPKTSTSPSRGWIRPMMERSSTDLPVPEPPTTPSTSPR